MDIQWTSSGSLCFLATLPHSVGYEEMNAPLTFERELLLLTVRLFSRFAVCISHIGEISGVLIQFGQQLVDLSAVALGPFLKVQFDHLPSIYDVESHAESNESLFIYWLSTCP